MPGPGFGVPDTVTGGQEAAQAPEQALRDPLSFSKR